MLPGSLQGLGGLDHRSFRDGGALSSMPAETAILRDRNDHEATDTPEDLDDDRSARRRDG